MTAPECDTCARLEAEARDLARLDWWAAYAKREELAAHRQECENCAEQSPQF
ncbi:MAG: hypothetical protein WC710_14130 [Gallionella sp.]